MIGNTVSHYKIIEKLGEGGMGVVYKARDTKLDREVAIKFLSPHLSSDPEAVKRFVHEAKAASAIDHSHIGTIYEIDEAEDGTTFIVMAFYAGETLRDRMDRGALGIEESLDIASQIASGLSKAQRKNIVHRDIKPSNIIITSDGEVKIIDFGLAKLAGRTRLTKEASTLGTAAYMSPEQARGDEVDGKSDIFSLGVILFEMLTGDPPFKGEHEAALLYEIVHEEPKPLIRYRSNISRGFQNIVDKALKKKSSDRYQDADEMLSDMTSMLRETEPVNASRSADKDVSHKKIIVGSISILFVIAALVITIRYFPSRRTDLPSERIMIAVLPFTNRGLPEDEYFSDGITDAITARLVSIKGLGVIARQSVVQYKNSDMSIQTIAKELGGVEYILEGTVQRDRSSDPSSMVRVIPQLIRTADGIQLWADTYDEVMIKIFEIQSEVAERVAEELNVVLLSQERRALRVKPTDDIEAYEYYLKGRVYEEHSYKRSDIEISIELFEEAAKRDPNFADAYARITMQHCMMYWYGYDRSAERLDMAKAAIDKALILKPDDPLIRAANGYYHYWGFRDYESALEEFSFARRKEPGNSLYIIGIALIQRRMGKFEEALQNQKIAYQSNPRSCLIARGVGLTYSFLGMFAEAENYWDRAISIDPDIELNYGFKAGIHLERTRSTEGARKVLEQALNRFGPLAFGWDFVYFDIFDGHYQVALDRLVSIQEEVDARYLLYQTKDAIRGFIFKLMGRPEQARNQYEKARTYLEKVVIEQPDDARIHIELGKIYAHLGLKDHAISEWKAVVELIPISRDAMDGPLYMLGLAEIYTILGDYDEALDILEGLPMILTLNYNGYIGALKINPIWSPLRTYPRFQKLLRDDT